MFMNQWCPSNRLLGLLGIQKSSYLSLSFVATSEYEVKFHLSSLNGGSFIPVIEPLTKLPLLYSFGWSSSGYDFILFSMTYSFPFLSKIVKSLCLFYLSTLSKLCKSKSLKKACIRPLYSFLLIRYAQKLGWKSSYDSRGIEYRGEFSSLWIWSMYMLFCMVDFAKSK